MKNSSTLLLYTLIILFLNSCGDEAKENNTKTMTNPVDTYLDSRVDAMDLAKKISSTPLAATSSSNSAQI